jgi:hypothetical protein
MYDMEALVFAAFVVVLLYFGVLGLLLLIAWAGWWSLIAVPPLLLWLAWMRHQRVRLNRELQAHRQIRGKGCSLHHSELHAALAETSRDRRLASIHWGRHERREWDDLAAHGLGDRPGPSQAQVQRYRLLDGRLRDA